MKIQAQQISKQRGTIRLKVGDIELFMYGPHIIGCQTPDGALRTDVFSLKLNGHAQRELIRRKQTECLLDAGWVSAANKEEISEMVYRGWMKHYAEFARQRMAGDIDA